MPPKKYINLFFSLLYVVGENVLEDKFWNNLEKLFHFCILLRKIYFRKFSKNKKFISENFHKWIFFFQIWKFSKMTFPQKGAKMKYFFNISNSICPISSIKTGKKFNCWKSSCFCHLIKKKIEKLLVTSWQLHGQSWI